MKVVELSPDKFKHYVEVKNRMAEGFVEHKAFAGIIDGEVVSVIITAKARIVAIVVIEEYRRMGYGTEMADYHLHHLGQGVQTISVAMHDSATLAFLFSIGFRNEGHTTTLYDERHSVRRLLLKRSANQTFETDTTLDAIEEELNTLLENIVVV